MYCLSNKSLCARVHETYRGKRRHAISARQSTPTAFAQVPADIISSFWAFVIKESEAYSDGISHRYEESHKCKIQVLQGRKSRQDQKSLIIENVLNARSNPFYTPYETHGTSHRFATYPGTCEENYWHPWAGGAWLETRKGSPLIPCSCIAATFSKENPSEYIMNATSHAFRRSTSFSSTATTKSRNRIRKL